MAAAAPRPPRLPTQAELAAIERARQVERLQREVTQLQRAADDRNLITTTEETKSTALQADDTFLRTSYFARLVRSSYSWWVTIIISLLFFVGILLVEVANNGDIPGTLMIVAGSLLLFVKIALISIHPHDNNSLTGERLTFPFIILMVFIAVLSSTLLGNASNGKGNKKAKLGVGIVATLAYAAWLVSLAASNYN